MSQTHDEMDDLYELLNRADELLDEEHDPEADEGFTPAFEDPVDMDATIVFRNAANHYGRDVRNAANGYGTAQPPEEAVPVDDEYADEPAGPSIHAYNADFRRTRSGSRQTPRKTVYSREPEPPRRQAQPQPAAPPSKKVKRKKRGCLTSLIAVFLVIALSITAFNFFLRPPKSDQPISTRKPGTAAILLCGADIGGERTDTMMLLYVDAFKRQAGLLSLPRDTYTETDYGAANKLNSAYGRNGGGEEGMQVLLDYVQDLIGYRPDGYMLIELPMLKDLIDLMGGVNFDVPQEMGMDGLEQYSTLQPGMQHLNGEQALALLRFRYGYVDQDLGRQNVQKQVLKACMEQWATAQNFGKVFDVLELFRTESLTNLSSGNLIWLGVNLLWCGFSQMSTDTLPGYATYVGDQSFYVLDPQGVADLIQEKYNPYTKEITTEDLHIAIG